MSRAPSAIRKRYKVNAMSRIKTVAHFITTCLFFFALPAAAAEDRALSLEKIKLPPGFSIELWAEVPNARELALGKNGTVFSGSSSEGKVYAITESAGRREVKTLAVGLTSPIGVAFRDGALYVSAINRILRFDDIENRLDQPGKPAVVTDIYPNEKHHGGKFIAFGPDGLLYVAVGAPCNICEPPEPFASITRIKPNGTDFEIYAQGIRNTVGFDWHPETKEL